MKCREFIDFLSDYVDGQLPDTQVVVFEEHLHRCPRCVIYLENYRQSIALGRDACKCLDQDVPEDVPAALVHAILEALKRDK